MLAKLSRRKLAQFTASQLLANDSDIVNQLAALIIAEKRQREVGLIVRDIEEALAERGVVIATTTTAHRLSQQVRTAISDLVDAKTVIINEQIDSSVIGGVKINLPGKRYDGTVKYKISELRAQKV